MDDIKIGSNKSFGTVFFIVFTLIGLYPLLKGGNLNIISILIGIIFLILGILNSRFLTPLNKIWFKFGLLLGQIISPVVMGIIFFLVVTPIAFIMRILGKDVLRLKKNNNSYWIKKTDLKSKMKNQF
jgi:large-conductance mechanosensitive channel